MTDPASRRAVDPPETAVFLSARRWRITSGFVLLAYVLCHLAVHASGILGIDGMVTASGWLQAPWSEYRVGQAVLYGALVIHMGLGLLALVHRRTLAMPLAEQLQLWLGLAIPLILIEHIVGTRLAAELAGSTPDFPFVMLIYWEDVPWLGIQQILLVLILWAHAMIGLNRWLAAATTRRRGAPILTVVATVVPILSLTGFVVAGFDLLDQLDRDIDLYFDIYDAARPPNVVEYVFLTELLTGLRGGYAGLVIVAVAVGPGRSLVTYPRQVRVAYPGGRVVTVPIGTTVLETSRRAGIPHRSVCGGRARCSTCRVQVTRGADTLPPPAGEEAVTLARIGATPAMRLACQIRPQHDLAVAPLLAVGRRLPAPKQVLGGRELTIAALAVDVRNSTALGEQILPYDAMFVIDSYVRAVAQVIATHDGIMNGVAGDGIMAIFGVDGDAERAARNALMAAVGIRQAVAQLDQDLRDTLPFPLRIGIGVHLGPAIVGEIGIEDRQVLNFLGDTGNVAARLEALTKDHKVDLVMSCTVAKAAGIVEPPDPPVIAQLRGRTREIEVIPVTDPDRLFADTAEPVSAGAGTAP